MRYKYKPLKKPKNDAHLTRQLLWLANHMVDIGTNLEYYGGLRAEMAERGRDLVDLATVCQCWAADLITEKVGAGETAP